MQDAVTQIEAERLATELEDVDATNLDCESTGAGDNCRQAAAALRALAAENAQLRQELNTGWRAMADAPAEGDWVVLRRENQPLADGRGYTAGAVAPALRREGRWVFPVPPDLRDILGDFMEFPDPDGWRPLSADAHLISEPSTPDATLAQRLRDEAAAMRAAVNAERIGETFHAFNWGDKPHRVLYDATRMMLEAADALTARVRLLGIQDPRAIWLHGYEIGFGHGKGDDGEGFTKGNGYEPSFEDFGPHTPYLEGEET